MAFNKSDFNALVTYHNDDIVCYHRRIREDSSVVLSFIGYDEDNCICTHCGKIIPKTTAFEYEHYLEDLK